MAYRVDSYFDVRVPIQDIPATPSHCPVPLPKHILSPSVIANSLQCVSYSVNVLTTHSQRTALSDNAIDISILFTDKHILSPEQFNRNLLRQIFRKASYYMNLVIEHKPIPPLLEGRIIGLLFYTPSTRTRCSFESAVMRLGGNTIYVGAHESSVQKGESFNDTVRTLDSYVDGLIIRTPNDIALDTYKHIARHTIINAGDRDEHPTQALLDLFTIRETRGTINNLTICIIGDCLHGRTVSSLVKILCNYTATIYFVPEPGFEPSEALLKYVSSHGVSVSIMPIITDTSIFLEIIPTIDVIYMTRIQKERVIDGRQQQQPLKWSITPGLLSYCKKDMIILHPLPRNEELPESVDKDSRALYFKQMEYGLYLRMAIVDLMFGSKL
jgi:aspartate carbamoyltransferase